MGDIIYPPPDDLPPGSDCVACTPAVFASGAWPKVLYAFFTGMTACSGFPSPPNHHYFPLQQSPTPCRYEILIDYNGDEWWIQLELTIARLRLWNQDHPGGVTFWGTAAPCSLAFPTNIAACPGNNAQGGSAIVTARPTPLTTLLCTEYALMPWGYMQPGSMLPVHEARSEDDPVGMDHHMVRLARKQDHSCVYVYIDEEDLPK